MSIPCLFPRFIDRSLPRGIERTFPVCYLQRTRVASRRRTSFPRKPEESLAHPGHPRAQRPHPSLPGRPRLGEGGSDLPGTSRSGRRIRRRAPFGGIGKGDRVAILAHNSILYLEALFAVTRAGAALVPLNHLLIGRELVAILVDADVKALLFTEEFRDRVGEIRPSLPGIGCFV